MGRFCVVGSVRHGGRYSVFYGNHLTGRKASGMQSELSPHWVIQSGEQVMQRPDTSTIPGGKGGHQERLTDKQWALEMPLTFL